MVNLSYLNMWLNRSAVCATTGAVEIRS